MSQQIQFPFVSTFPPNQFSNLFNFPQPQVQPPAPLFGQTSQSVFTSINNNDTSNDGAYILYKTTDKGKINVGYFKNVNDIISHFSDTKYDLIHDPIKWFEVDKININNKNIESFVLIHNGFVSKQDNKTHNFNTQLPPHYINLMARIEYKCMMREIDEAKKKIDNKLNNNFITINCDKLIEIQEISNKFQQFEKSL